MAHEFINIIPADAGEATNVEFHGVPFSVVPDEQGLRNLQPGVYEVNKALDKLFFLGMTTKKAECSEWWGPSPRWYDNGTRVFIGDRVGRINVNYADGTQDIFPVILGVNCWPYELYNTFYQDGPFDEPFASDAEAKRLLDESLLLLENDAEKGMKYIFTVRPRKKEIASIELLKEDFKDAGFQVTGITGIAPGVKQPEEWKAYDDRFFLRQEYYPAMDRLARRLYQFRDEIPESVGQVLPRGYKGAKVKFTGNVYADILTNVYSHNIWDMATDKIDARGMIHTSSRKAANFGGYQGFGTFKENVGMYYPEAWSRDAGRSLMEVIEWGECDRSVKAGEKALHYLYDKGLRYNRPNWRRIMNSSELGDEKMQFAAGKENDGHGAMMLSLYRLYQQKCVEKAWAKQNWKGFTDAAEWFCWQIENPRESNFHKVLHSESETATQGPGGYDLFSNVTAYYALRAFGRVAAEVNKSKESDRWNELANRLWDGISDVFTTQHPRYGTIFVDCNWDCWTWEYKRFAPLFLASDLLTYDLAVTDPDLYNICVNTYKAQKEEFFSYDAGRQMGYGQGFITQTAIMLDELEDIKGLIEQAAAFCYHHSDHNYVVPEGVISHPSGRFWYRNSDLGNSVQQAEIIKCARLLIGLDDLNPDMGLTIIPRLPEGWESIQVREYPVVAISDGKQLRIDLEYNLKRIDNGYELILKAAKTIDQVRFRIGPFPWEAKQIKVRGEKHVEVKPMNIGRNQYAYFGIKGVKSVKLEIVMIR